MPVFDNDDAGYIAWVQEHPFGHVVNAENPPRPSYLVLHRADCHTINPEKARPDQSWTHLYIKVCGESVETLERWAITRFGQNRSGLRLCGHCENAGRV